jgi:hypothetical protein
MHSPAVASRRLALITTLLALALPAAASAAMTTAGNDTARTAWFPDQPQLNPATVGAGQVQQVFSTPVQGQVYAQPIVANNTLLVATQEDWIYGLDPNSGAQRWARQVHQPFDIAHDSVLGCQDIQPSVGITSTPVVDPTTNTAYLWAKAGASDGWAYYFHGIDLSTGQDRFPPVRLADQAAQNVNAHFRPRFQLQRVALLLMDGTVYAAFGSHCDADPSQGWVVGVSTSGQLRSIWGSRKDDPGTPQEESGGGIWQDGGGIVSDRPGSMLVVTGSNNNGGVPGGDPNQDGQDPNSAPIAGNNPPDDIGESVVRLNVQSNGQLQAADFFSPHDNWLMDLDSHDSDFNSGGPSALPASFGTSTYPNVMVAGGKSGDLFLLNRDSLGGFPGSQGTDNALQRQGTTVWPYGPIVSRFAAWPGDGGYVYSVTGWWGGTPNGEFGNGGPLNVYKRVVGPGDKPQLQLVSTTPATNTPGENMGYASSGMSISSNGTQSGSAVAWMVWQPVSSGAGAQLRAYDAVPQNGQMKLLWSAPIGQGSKFNPPAISDNHVYVGTRDGHIIGFKGPDAPQGGGPGSGGPGKIALSSLKISPRKFAPRTTVTETRNGKKRRRRVGGATLRFTSSAAATVQLTVQKKTVGRKVKKRCVRTTRKNRSKHRCARWVSKAGKINIKAKAGKNRYFFDGRLRHRRLSRSSYRFVVRPLDSKGKPVAGVVKRVSFKIVKSKR